MQMASGGLGMLVGMRTGSDSKSFHRRGCALKNSIQVRQAAEEIRKSFSLIHLFGKDAWMELGRSVCFGCVR
jgi:hypothetical protein